MVALLAETVTLGDAIRRFRVHAGMSQRTLAEISGVERSYISMLENNHRKNASYDIVSALAEAMGIPPSAIYREAEMPMPGPPHENDMAVRVDSPGKAAIFRRMARRWGEERLRQLEQMGLVAFPDIEGDQAIIANIEAEETDDFAEADGRPEPPDFTEQPAT
jgi:transcriptional regulator with XRE-family HTH domain